MGEGWLLRNVAKKLHREVGDDAADLRWIFTEPRKSYRIAVEEGTKRNHADSPE